MAKRKNPSQKSSKSQKVSSIPDHWRSVVGIHSCFEVLKVRSKSVECLFLRQGYEENPELKEIFELANQEKVRVNCVKPAELERLGQGHQGVGLYVSESPEFDPKILDKEGPQILLILDEVEDPQNLGSILRTSWLFGVSAVIIPQNRSVHLTAAVSKVACGGAEHVPVEVESSLPNFLSHLKDKGFWVYALDHRATKSIYKEEFSEKIALVIGSEGRGLRSTVSGACDEKLFIPQMDSEASLNASVATAVALSECRRQHLGQAQKP